MLMGVGGDADAAARDGGALPGVMMVGADEGGEGASPDRELEGQSQAPFSQLGAGGEGTVPSRAPSTTILSAPPP